MKRIPYALLVPAALLLALSPLGAEPHLVEKLRMLVSGRLTRPLDIFDLVLHGGPLVLLAAKGAMDLARWRRAGTAGAPAAADPPGPTKASDPAGHVDPQSPGPGMGPRQ